MKEKSGPTGEEGLEKHIIMNYALSEYTSYIYKNPKENRTIPQSGFYIEK